MPCVAFRRRFPIPCSNPCLFSQQPEARNDASPSLAPLTFSELEAHLRQPLAGRRAVVIGASIAGLLAARVLADRFDEVVLLDRGRLPDGDEHRKATPHTQHAHGMLARGLQVLEELFPGITDECVARGGTLADMQSDVAFYAGGRRFAQVPAGIACIAVGRVVLEGAVRRRVLAMPGVRACDAVDVRQLLCGDDPSRITGVLARSVPAGTAMLVPAGLVVDAAGRASRLPQWLQALGYESAEEQRVQVDISYATAYLHRDEPRAAGMSGVVCAPDNARPQIGVMLSQEDDRWVVTLGGYRDDPPPLVRDAFVERARQMGRELAETVAGAEFAAAPIGYRFPHSERRRYERLRRFPSGLLAIGDSICSFNPIYGQGMSVVACEALVLRDCLKRGEAWLWKRYFRRASRVVDAAWNTAVGADLAMDSIEGPRSVVGNLLNRYVALVFRASVHDPRVARAFLRVAHLLAPPPSLLAPAVVARVCHALWRQRKGG